MGPFPEHLLDPQIKDMGVEPKIGGTNPNHPMFHRGFEPFFSPSILGDKFSPLFFGSTPLC